MRPSGFSKHVRATKILFIIQKTFYAWALLRRTKQDAICIKWWVKFGRSFVFKKTEGPAARIKFLGTCIDTVRLTLSAPEDSLLTLSHSWTSFQSFAPAPKESSKPNRIVKFCDKVYTGWKDVCSTNDKHALPRPKTSPPRKFIGKFSPRR